MTQISRNDRLKLAFVAAIAWVAVITLFTSNPAADSFTLTKAPTVAQGKKKSQKQDPKSAGCLTCHEGSESMHQSPSDFELGIGCVDCHGGNPEPAISPGMTRGSAEYNQVKDRAHVQPRYPEAWGKNRKEPSSRNPERTNALLLRESPEFVRFINPGDLRAAGISCGTASCHPQEVYQVRKSMMTHGGMLWGAIFYNNGAIPYKNTRFGESYTIDGRPQRMQTIPLPTAEETRLKGVIPYLNPPPRYEATHPGNVLRVFERGGGEKGFPSDIGSPNIEEDPGKPDIKLSSRGFGTELRTDPTFQGIQKTRLLDPLLSFLGTNDQPGDYRSSGCTSCHVIYANDRDRFHSAEFAKYGNRGMTQTADPTITKLEPGHPIKHQMTNGIPSSQCMVCHIHPGANMVLGYFGYIWWDNETDGEHMYKGAKPSEELSEEEKEQIRERNPEGSAIRGLWGQNKEFLIELWKEVNPKLKHTQFADLHGHGWVFRAVYKQDRYGNLLDEKGNKIDFNDPEKFKKVVQLRDIHLEKGMHCVDCHFRGDSHGNGNIYGEPRAAIEITCIDCHGTIYQRATGITSGPAAGQGRYNGKVINNKKGLDLSKVRTPFGKRVFEVDKKTGDIYQNSMVTEGLRWKVVQTLDSIDPNHPDYKPKSRYAKTYRTDGTWGDVPDRKDDIDRPGRESVLAHSDKKLTCFACHTAWTTSCFGCHLPMEANRNRPLLHNEGFSKEGYSRDNYRNWTQYNYQTLRDDIWFLAVDGTVMGHKISPARSSCAILVDSQNQNRNFTYIQQQTISSEGFSGQAFSTFVPHTVRATETKTCTDCHLSKAKDNNAWMAQVLMQGTNLVNFMYKYVYVATGHHGFEAIQVTEHDQPQAVIGSKLHEMAYPIQYKKLKKNPHGEGFYPKTNVYEHRANGSEIRSLQLRGEYLYTANGTGGFRVYDVNAIDVKDFSERIVTAPVSPLGQKFYVRSKDATSIASPTTLGVDPTRQRFPENEEQPIPLLYAFLYGTDKEEGFIVIGNNPANPALKRKKTKKGEILKDGPGVGTLLDGEPRNNFISRAVTFNPDGKLKGAMNVTIAGNYAYVSTDHGLYVIDISNPLDPKITAEIGEPFLKNPHAVAVQYRYAFVVDDEGLKVLNVSNLAKPRPVEKAKLAIEDTHNIYVARTYAYIAAGKNGLAIVDVLKPEEPKLYQMYNAGGEINDTHDVKVGMTINTAFAYLADGKHGLRVVQLFGPDSNEDIYGWSPKPKPQLIATYHTAGEALAISKGLDRDRAVDESGNQLAVFNRRGSRPFNKQEMDKMAVVVSDKTDEQIQKESAKARRFVRPDSKQTSAVESEEEIQTSSLEGVNPLYLGLAGFFLPLFILIKRRFRE